jgi:hypothetical protein
MSLDLDAIEARANAATPGPWWADADKGGEVSLWQVDPSDVDMAYFPAADADNEFIATARTDVPALVAEVRRQQEHAANARRRESKERGARVDAEERAAVAEALAARLEAKLEKQRKTAAAKAKALRDQVADLERQLAEANANADRWYIEATKNRPGVSA